MRAPQDEDSIAFQPSSRCQTAHLVPAAHVCARGLHLLHSPRIEGWAERRETFGCVRGTRGYAITRRTRRLRGALRPITRDARLSALHRGDFSPGAALPSPSAPAVLQRRAVAFGSVQRAPRSQVVVPWRATSRASRGERLRAAAAGRHASLRDNFLQTLEIYRL